jgi:hypothetical protein
VLLTAEELHWLATAQGLEFVPGLGPPPLDPADPAALRLMLGTAERSLAVGEVAPEAEALLAGLQTPQWTASAEVIGGELMGARGWWPVDGGVAELTQTSPSDYELVVVEALAPSVADFLFLEGDDDVQGPPEPADDARLEALAAEAVVIARASRLTRAGEGAEGVALAWIDPGGDGPVWVVEDGTVAATGRAAVLRELLDRHLD